MWACQWPSSQPLSSPQLPHNDSLWAKVISKSHREQGRDYREGDELSWCPSWSNSQWRGWSCGLVHCPSGNATDPIWRVLDSSQGISSWTPLKPQHSNHNPNPVGESTLVYWLPYSTHTSHHPSQTPCLPWISYATQKLMLSSCKIVEKQSEALQPFLWHFFPSLKQNFIAYHSSKVSSRPDCIFEIDQLWQSGFSRVNSNCCCSCSFEAEFIEIGQSSHKMYRKNILNFQESTTILNGYTKNLETYWMHHVFLIEIICSYMVSSNFIFGNFQTIIQNFKKCYHLKCTKRFRKIVTIS